MKALHRLTASEGIAAMRSINVTVVRLWFPGPFFATAVVSFPMLLGRQASL